jgi:phenylacetate-coenzyme A ligase PaaK-like adenylate-forming protein
MDSAREVAVFGLELLAAYRRTTSTRATVRAVQRKRLEEMLAAARRVPFYAGQDLRTLHDITPTKKADFLDRLQDTVSDEALTRARLFTHVQGGGAPGALLLGRYLLATTSGTSGQIGVFVDDVSGWARHRAVLFARMFQGLLTFQGFALLAKRRYRLAFVVAVGGHWLTSILAGRVPKIGQLLLDSRVVPIDWPLFRIVEELNAFQPLLLHSYPTFLEVLAAEQRRGTLRIAPEIITAGSEPTTPGCRESVRAAFPSARFVETYAATECLAMATACPQGVLHVNEDACILEPVDDDHRPVPYGQVAQRVLVTNLLNTVQPLLRYELTDSVVIDDRPCACGSPFLVIRVQGRNDDTFFLVDGAGRAQAHPPIPMEVSLLGVAGLLQYQLVHEAQNRLRLAFVVERTGANASAVARALDERMSRYLFEHGLLHEVSYAVEQVDAIDRHARSRKLRQIMSRVAKPAGPLISASAARRPR